MAEPATDGRSIELAMMLRERIDSDPLIGKYFDVLAPEQMVLEEYRPSGLKEYFSKSNGWGTLYTTTYEPSTGNFTCRWPGFSIESNIQEFKEQAIALRFK